jgi:N-acetylmuramoyl-L-alanine amidase
LEEGLILGGRARTGARAEESPLSRPRLVPRAATEVAARPLASEHTREEPPVGRREFVQRLENRSRAIQDPVAKLKYIRSSLARYQAIDSAVGHVIPWTPARRGLYWLFSLKGLRQFLAMSPMAAEHEVEQRRRSALMLRRGVAVGLATALLLGVAGLAYRGSRRNGEMTSSPAGQSLPPVAEELPALPQGVAPAAVWLVEKGEGFEQYSNGLRIDTTYTVTGDPRRYRVFMQDGTLLENVYDKPIGILFHTSESDIWPLEAAFNENLRDSSQKLLRYLQRGKLYHYLIDRFGRVYRVTDEGSKANHAGHSVWARDGRVYINLNHAFIGISFETRWEGGRALPITQAQLAAGRNLTEYVKQRYQISPDMCVTHGLTSVNPKKRLIGHHMDWSRGFPFAAFGLPDQYAKEAPSVSIFAFGYDDDFLKVLGEPWPGVRVAEAALEAEAARQGQSLDELRRERQARYDVWFAEQTKDEETRVASRTDHPQGSGTQPPGGSPSLPARTASGGGAAAFK